MQSLIFYCFLLHQELLILFERYYFYTVPAVQLKNTAILKNVESLLFGKLLHIELHLIMKWRWLSRYVYVEIHFVGYL